MLIFPNSISMIDPLKRAWILIYASKSCQCQIYIDFYTLLWIDAGFLLISTCTVE
jgi:hypothetical protein